MKIVIRNSESVLEFQDFELLPVLYAITMVLIKVLGSPDNPQCRLLADRVEYGCKP
jgi:hypothetical protein